MVTVLIPTVLRKFSGNRDALQCCGGNLTEVLVALENLSPGISSRLCDETGELRRFINFYVNDEDVRFLQGRHTPLKAGDILSIVPALAGG